VSWGVAPDAVRLDGDRHGGLACLGRQRGGQSSRGGWFPSSTPLTVSSPEASTRHHAGVAVSGLFSVDLSSAEPPMPCHRAEIDREQSFPEGCPGTAAGSNDIADDDHDAEPDDPIHLAQEV
jgi:hypothetical protein